MPKALQLADMLWKGVGCQAPSHVTILDWVEKCGLSLTQGSLKDKTAEQANYSLIIDNSVTICGQNLHMELKASSAHQGHPLTHADVEIVKVKVETGWNKEKIKNQLIETVFSEGRKPDYIVCDNDNTLCNACNELGIANHRDISHSFGMFLERVYSKDAEFREFIAQKGYARKFSHTPMAPLMPPRRRDYARFMNVFDTVHWAKAVLDGEYLLSSHERWLLDFVWQHASLVDELDEVMRAYEHLESLCKQKGLSHKTASECRRYINENLMTRGDRVRRLADMLIGYFNREESLLREGGNHNICSDIIESTFGYLKGRMSPNKNNGYTPLVLLIPLHFRVSTMEDCKSFRARGIIDKSTIQDVKKWRSDNLMPNPSNKRLKLLKNAV